jgi:CHASE2 domain-containing sensor protein
MVGELTPEEKSQRTKRIWRDVRHWLLLACLMFAAKWAFEHTSMGEHFKLATYRFLHQNFIPNRHEGELPVAIVDISNLPIESITIDGHKYEATPRDKLLALIKSIVAQEPAAIGIDIDFSPNQEGYITPGDPQFFQSCLDIRKESKVPIFLGIKRSEIYPSDHWLGAEDYKTLAASIFLPQRDTRKLWKSIKPREDLPPVPTMAAVLAESLQASETRVPTWLRWAVDQFSERQLGPGYSVNEYLVDYTRLDSIEQSRIKTFAPEGIEAQGHLLVNKIVLIGDATLGQAKDTFPVAVRPQPVPGVYMHASGAYTLATSALYELTGKGRWAIDILLTLVIISAITGIRLYLRNKTPADLDTHWLQGAVTILVVIVASLLAIVFVRQTRVLWDDSILVFGGLFLHPRFERVLHGLKTFSKEDVVPIIRRRLFKLPKKEKP